MAGKGREEWGGGVIRREEGETEKRGEKCGEEGGISVIPQFERELRS